ncbi:MAG: hypothetical protein ABSA02_25585 [Trebonia sp.]
MLRLLACMTLPWILGNRPLACAVIIVIVGSSIIVAFRNFVGADGADQMTVLIFVSLLLYTVTGDRVTQSLAVGFLGAQCILSYVVAGMAKSVSPVWRNGLALKGIFRTETYGVALVGNTLSSLPGNMNRLLCWAVIVWESTFFAVLFLPLPVCLAMLALAAAFHIFNAFTMGLNTFVWSFVAGYPAILVMNHWLELRV